MAEAIIIIPFLRTYWFSLCTRTSMKYSVGCVMASFRLSMDAAEEMRIKITNGNLLITGTRQRANNGPFFMYESNRACPASRASDSEMPIGRQRAHTSHTHTLSELLVECVRVCGQAIKWKRYVFEMFDRFVRTKFHPTTMSKLEPNEKDELVAGLEMRRPISSCNWWRT